jgi:hypothetical protein
MKKGIILILLIIFLVFASARIIFASYSSPSYGSIFGGRIIYTKAIEIVNLESTGYICNTPGTSVSIRPMGSPLGTPTSYLIPFGVTPRTRTTPTPGQLIMGKYGAPTSIECKKPGSERTGGRSDLKTMSLPTINLFGTSRY